MSNVSRKREQMLQEYALEHGEQKASEKYGLSLETLHRYFRTVNDKTNRHPKILLFDVETSILTILSLVKAVLLN